MIMTTPKDAVFTALESNSEASFKDFVANCSGI